MGTGCSNQTETGGKIKESQQCHKGVMSNGMTSVLVFPNAGSLVGRHPLTQLRGDGGGVGVGGKDTK